jgi:hypothetical protein
MDDVTYSYPLGEYAGEQIQLAVDLSPADVRTREEVESYAVMLYYVRETADGDGEEVVIARIDDRQHGGPHLDRLFSDDGERRFFSEGFDFDDDETHLVDRWERYARLYRENRCL